MSKKLVPVEFLGVIERLPEMPRECCLLVFGDPAADAAVSIVAPAAQIREFQARHAGKAVRRGNAWIASLGLLAGHGLGASGARGLTVILERAGRCRGEGVQATLLYVTPDGLPHTAPADVVSALEVAAISGAAFLAERRLLDLSLAGLAREGVRIHAPGRDLKPPDDKAFRTFLARVEPADFARYMERQEEP
ncbi:MAG: hypothetical protein FJZ01_06220 [Candidatus Sericytochromatia bacterium]|nr:hypothetical protein [Candidatus Tanganyikabacteria bacterium]